MRGVPGSETQLLTLPERGVVQAERMQALVAASRQVLGCLTVALDANEAGERAELREVLRCLRRARREMQAALKPWAAGGYQRVIP